MNWFQWEKRFGVTRQDQSQMVEINGTLVKAETSLRHQSLTFLLHNIIRGKQ